MVTNIHLDTNVRGKIKIFFFSLWYSSDFTDKFFRVYRLKCSSLVMRIFFPTTFPTFLTFPKMRVQSWQHWYAIQHWEMYLTCHWKIKFYRFDKLKFLRFSNIDCVESELRLLMTGFSFSIRRRYVNSRREQFYNHILTFRKICLSKLSLSLSKVQHKSRRFWYLNYLIVFIILTILTLSCIARYLRRLNSIESIQNTGTAWHGMSRMQNTYQWWFGVPCSLKGWILFGFYRNRDETIMRIDCV